MTNEVTEADLPHLRRCAELAAEAVGARPAPQIPLSVAPRPGRPRQPSPAGSPHLPACRVPAIVNVLSVTAWAALPVIPAYSISKAAAFSLSQSLRALLAGRGVRVHAVLTGPVDTDMSRGLDIPKASPESVARAIFDGVENGEEEIFPDPISASMAESWRGGAAKALERQYAALVAAEPVKA
jgi:short-subunit dehydrogenase